MADKQETGRWLNNRAENSHLPFQRQERAMQRFRSMRSLQKFAAKWWTGIVRCAWRDRQRNFGSSYLVFDNNVELKRESDSIIGGNLTPSLEVLETTFFLGWEATILS